MPWYEPQIDTPYGDQRQSRRHPSAGPEETETDRMWRRIAPQVQAKVEQARNKVED